MDQYFIVAELKFPPGRLASWLELPAPPSDEIVGQLLDWAEGDVLANVDGDHFSLRALLVDHELFAVEKPLLGAFARAAEMGATGRWYSGDFFRGKTAELDGSAGPVVKALRTPGSPIREWMAEAAAYSRASGEGTAPRRTPLLTESAESPPAEAPSSPKKPVSRAAAKRPQRR